MDYTNKLSDFITEDMAYLIGMIVGKGTFVYKNDVTRLIINFPFKNLQAKGLHKTYDTELYLLQSVDRIVNRIKKLGLDINKEIDNDNGVSLIVTWHEKADVHSQLLHYLLNSEHSDYHSFRIPFAIYEADQEKQKEFLRGYFDVTGHVRTSNRNQSGQHRVYLEIDHRNWLLVADLYILLTQNLAIPVQTIDFGHPNFRGDKNWAKEHQIKIYANQFLPIGSYLTHKDEVIKEFAAVNKPNIGEHKGEPRITPKPMVADESSTKLPSYLRGKHFNHNSELLDLLISQR